LPSLAIGSGDDNETGDPPTRFGEIEAMRGREDNCRSDQRPGAGKQPPVSRFTDEEDDR
jgi:hypothetical protein